VVDFITANMVIYTPGGHDQLYLGVNNQLHHGVDTADIDRLNCPTRIGVYRNRGLLPYIAS